MSVGSSRRHELFERKAERFAGGVVDVRFEHIHLFRIDSFFKDHRAENVGASEVAFAESDSGLFDFVFRRQTVAGADRGGDCDSGRSDHFAVCGCCAQRDAVRLRDVQHGGNRNGKVAVLTVHESAAFGEPGHHALADAEVVDQHGGGNNVDYGINGADFVEVNFGDGNAVGFGFRFRDDAEDFFREFPCSVRHGSAVDDGTDVVQVPVLVVMLMPVLMFMMVMIMQNHVEIGSCDSIGTFAGNAIFEAFQIHAPENGVEFFAACAEVEQGGNGHVAGNSGRAFQIKQFVFHVQFSSRICFSISCTVIAFSGAGQIS